MITHQKVIEFWFNEISPQKWFEIDPKVDKEIVARFKDIHTQACRGELNDWRRSIQGRLAEIIILDQFSRHIHRDQPEAYHQDLAALILAQMALKTNEDIDLPAMKKAFLYMPFMHSESVLMQRKSIELYSQEGLERNLESALEHKRVIDQFNRFPYRNKALRRRSTPEEIEFMSVNRELK